MDELKNLLNQLLEKYKKAALVLEKWESAIDTKSIEGHLEISKSHDTYQFYCKQKDNKEKEQKSQKRYLGRNESEVVRQLAQQSYNQNASVLISKRIKQLKKLLAGFNSDELDLLYDTLHPLRKKLVQPLLPTNQQKLESWKSQSFQSKPIRNVQEALYTNKNERVRSKSEKILADLFSAKGVDYQYERPLILPDGLRIYPDFTFYHPEKQVEIYWEHFGMMDVPEYANNAIRRIACYESAQIYLGERLLVTFETSQCTLNLRSAEALIQRHLWSNQT